MSQETLQTNKRHFHHPTPLPWDTDAIVHVLFFSMAEIVLLDEPTSGLDAFTARYLVSSLADLAHNQGKIVLLTIHQPRSDIFRMFDQVGIMSHGKTVYFGGSEQMLEYFDKLGYPCPTYTNPTDHYGMFPSRVFKQVSMAWKYYKHISQTNPGLSEE